MSMQELEDLRRRRDAAIAQAQGMSVTDTLNMAGKTAYEELLPGKELDKFIAGTKIGLNQQGQMKSGATQLGVDLADPAVQNGIKVTQTLKAGGELALMELLTGGIGGPLLAAMKVSKPLTAIVSKAAQAEKLIEKGSSADKLVRVIRDFSGGAATAIGANAGVNLGAAGLAAATGQDTFFGNAAETAGESAMQGAFGGVLNAGLQPAIKSASKLLGSKQAARDITEELINKGKAVTGKVDSAESSVVNTVKKIYAARAKDLAPIQKEINAAEKAIINSKKQIEVNKLPKEVQTFIQDLQKGDKFFKALNKSSEGAELLSIFKGKSFKKTPPLTIDGTAVNVIGDTITEPQLYKAYKSINSIKKKGAIAGEEFAIPKNVIESKGIDNKLLDMLPDGIKNAEKKFKPVYEKYGSSYDNNYADLNKVYDKIESGQEVSIEEATKALSASNSTKAKKLGSFVDAKVVSPKEIEQAALLNLDKKGSTFFQPTLYGKKGQAADLMKQGYSPEEIAAIEAESFTSTPLGTKIKNAFGMGGEAPNVRTMQDSNMLVDPLDVTAGMTKNQGNIQTSLGNSPEAQNLADEVRQLEFLKQKGPKTIKEAGSEAGLGQKLIQGIDGMSNLQNPQAVQTALARNQLLNQLGPQGFRQLLQSGSGLFFTNDQFNKAGM